MNPPTTHFALFDINGPDPSGQRHLTTASGYIKNLHTGAGGALDFGTLDISSGVIVDSPTKCVVWVVDDMGDATQKIFDMKFWICSTSDFVGLGTDYNVYFNQYITGMWHSGLKLTHSSGMYSSLSLPSGQNLYKWDGVKEITEAGTDNSVSQYIYLSVGVDPNIPVGIYGGDGTNGFRYRVTYKYL
ncbi:MAG: hypothetical protein DRP85_00820 [Candidatus Makaraimicrobium thalassicum]|nr:MAG: hypothetical protein DRP85_00820 [Candidatus Omnitrophota bacterium]